MEIPYCLGQASTGLRSEGVVGQLSWQGDAQLQLLSRKSLTREVLLCVFDDFVNEQRVRLEPHLPFEFAKLIALFSGDAY